MIWSVHGPALRTPKGVFALCFAGYGEIRHLEQWYRMNKAANLAEFKTAMRMNAIPSFNTVYADKHGDLFYAYNGQFPVRAPRVCVAKAPAWRYVEDALARAYPIRRAAPN